MRKFGIVLCLFFGNWYSVKGQSGDNAPIVYDQFFQNYFLLNPAQVEIKDRLNVSLGNRTLTGLFEGVNRFYADANFLLKSKKEERYHSVGAMATNNRDGELFNRNRIYGRYSWRASLGEYSAIAAGVSIGIINYSFRASAASGGGSSVKPDINFGTWYVREHFKVGLSYQQFLRPTLKPSNQEFKLADYLNANIIYSLELSPVLSLHNHLYYRYQKDEAFYFEFAPILLFSEKFEIGANYRHLHGVAIVAGIRSIEIGNNHFRFMASYLISTRKLTSINDGVLEFSFGYSLPNNSLE